MHVDADEEHQYIAVNELVGGLLETEPDQAGAVLFGAKAVALVERTFAQHVVAAWRTTGPPCGRRDGRLHRFSGRSPLPSHGEHDGEGSGKDPVNEVGDLLN